MKARPRRHQLVSESAAERKMAKERAIDAYNPDRKPKEMKVLVLGMAKTGTTSICAMLQQLGFTPHHMKEDIRKRPRVLNYWTEAARAKYAPAGGVVPYGRAEFDKLLGDYDATTDLPSVFFPEDLIAAYPDARIVLSTRDPDSWHRSMVATIWETYTWPSFRVLSYLDPSIVGPMMSFHSIFFDKFCGNDPGPPMKLAFIQHGERVREAARGAGREVLEYDVKDGWQPLCEFLGTPVPEGEIPAMNDSKAFVKGLSLLRNVVIVKVIAKYLLYSAATVGAGVAWVKYRY